MAKLGTSNKTYQQNTIPVANTKYLVSSASGKCNYQIFNTETEYETKKILTSQGLGQVQYQSITYADFDYNMRNNIDDIRLTSQGGYVRISDLTNVNSQEGGTNITFSGNCRYGQYLNPAYEGYSFSISFKRRTQQAMEYIANFINNSFLSYELDIDTNNASYEFQNVFTNPIMAGITSIYTEIGDFGFNDKAISERSGTFKLVLFN